MRKQRHLLFIPAYNCAPHLPWLLKEVFAEGREFISEVLIMDNRSDDDSLKEAMHIANAHFTVPTHGVLNRDNYGLGGSHKLAFDYALKMEFDSVIVLHGDHQASPQDMRKLVNRLERGVPVGAVLGSRFMRGSRRTGYSRLRTFGNFALNAAFSICLRKEVSDLGSGLNLFSTHALRKLNYHAYSDVCDFNIYLLLDLLEKSTVEFVPITWSESGQKSNVNPFKIGFSALKILLKHCTKGLPERAIDSARGYETVFRYAPQY